MRKIGLIYGEELLVNTKDKEKLELITKWFEKIDEYSRELQEMKSEEIMNKFGINDTYKTKPNSSIFYVLIIFIILILLF